MVNAHPDVVESAVVAADSELDEDEVLAVIVLKRRAKLQTSSFSHFLLKRCLTSWCLIHKNSGQTAENANPESTKSRTSATRCHPRYLGLYLSRPKSNQNGIKRQ